MPNANGTGPSETQLAERVTAFGWDGGKLEPGIALAMSGGGFRAMLFHAGALMRLNELAFCRRSKRISSVSGGSISAGHLVQSGKRSAAPTPAAPSTDFKTSYVAPILAFSRQIST